jgi:hypothetical protein
LACSDYWRPSWSSAVITRIDIAFSVRPVHSCTPHIVWRRECRGGDLLLPTPTIVLCRPSSFGGKVQPIFPIRSALLTADCKCTLTAPTTPPIDLGYKIVLEPTASNPYMELFYSDPKKYALKVSVVKLLVSLSCLSCSALVFGLCSRTTQCPFLALAYRFMRAGWCVCQSLGCGELRGSGLKVRTLC